MPAEQSFRSDDGRDAAQGVDAGLLCFGCKPNALAISKAWLSSELFPQDSDLLQQVINQELLVSIDLARQEEQAKLQNVHFHSSAVLLRASTAEFLDITRDWQRCVGLPTENRESGSSAAG